MYNNSMNIIRQNLLTYIGYCLKKPVRRFGYPKCVASLKRVGINTKKATLYKEFSICKKEELIKLKTFYNKEVPVLTQKGHLEIRTRLPFKKFGPWDNKWRVVSINTPSVERSSRLKMIYILKKFGFGKLGRNLFITPYPLKTTIIRLATDLGIQKYVTFGELDILKDEKQEIGVAWQADEINKTYQDFIDEAKTAPKDYCWPLRAKKLENVFALIYELDPHLPKQFLPTNWYGNEAYSIFKAISNSY